MKQATKEQMQYMSEPLSTGLQEVRNVANIRGYGKGKSAQSI
jgi:hypothetical protein